MIYSVADDAPHSWRPPLLPRRQPPVTHPNPATAPEFIPPDAVAFERHRMLRWDTVPHLTQAARVLAVQIALGHREWSECMGLLMHHWGRVTRRDPESPQWDKALAAFEGIMEAQVAVSEELLDWEASP